LKKLTQPLKALATLHF